jgi:hypothetical protein
LIKIQFFTSRPYNFITKAKDRTLKKYIIGKSYDLMLQQ